MKPTDTQIKLKKAAEEIKEVLRKHDIAAAVALHDIGHGEHFIHLNPTYSCAYIYEDSAVRFYSKRKDFKTAQEQQTKQTATSNMLRMLTDLTVINLSMLQPMTKVFDEITHAEHSSIKRT